MEIEHSGGWRMSGNQTFELPDLIYLDNYGGGFYSYFEAVYQAFKIDYIYSKPTYRGTKLQLKKYPIVDNREATFYHITHEGSDETNRLPDLRRMERIRYPRYLIENSTHSKLLVWENKRGKDTRILIYYPDEYYLVVLNKRKNYLLLWTAYIVDIPHRRRDLLEEYEVYKKTNAAQ
ncbi:MAG: hypothetical protein KAF40_03420 [Flavihumibacter sp.]|nr:hypothetical protein [Flavihumibacter sp.]